MATQLPRSLREIEVMLASIYDRHDRQFYPSIRDLTLKLIWAIGVFSSAQRKGDGGKVPEFLADCFAWWIAVCNFVKFSAEDVLWEKFPRICPYCGAKRNDDCEGQKNRRRIPGSVVEEYRRTEPRPETVADWQAMFEMIYGMVNAKHGYHFAVARLPEEVSELIECLLPVIKDPQKLKMELADIGARIFALANLLRIELQEVFLARYPGRCPSCQKSECRDDPTKEAPA